MTTPRTDAEQRTSRKMAQVVHQPLARHAIAARSSGMVGIADVAPALTDSFAILHERCERARAGELQTETDMLVLQAATLDTLFIDLLKRAADNAGTHLDASATYLKLALKAQANSRATIEALAKIQRGGEQVVKHVHIDNRGGQAVVAEKRSTLGAESRK